MKNTDLRLGNIIADTNDNICFVTSLRNDLIIAKYTGVGSALGGIENFKGVPISEKWLTNLGFYRKAIGYGINLKRKTFSIGFENNYFRLQGIQFPNRIEYIHQLQNLFHSVTGEELNQI